MISRTSADDLKPRHLGIKVLSLFFVDHVDSYRVYNDDNTTSLGPFGTMFEEEYRSLAKRPEYAASLFTDAPPDPASAHDGYFSRDKRGAVVDAQLNVKGELKNQAAREAAERGYQLIMRDKERLLSETEPLRFIFSHSALREGWDNPNVFQICVLRSMGGERQRRQTIGRGLRLCVDATGERRRDEGLNSLTVIADETFEAFASGLQTEMEQDLGVRFGVVEAGSFATLSTHTPEGTPVPLGMTESQALFQYLRAQGFVNAKGEVEDSLRVALKTGTLVLPERFEAVAPAVRAHLTRLARRLEVRNAAERRTVTLNRQVFLSDDFRALWDSIKARTTYRLHFDPEALIKSAAEEIAVMPAVARAQIRFRRATLAVERSGLEARGETTTDQTSLATNAEDIPDLLGELQARTGLVRRSLVRILRGSGRLDDLRANPSAFLDAAAAAIGRAKRRCLVDGVKYEKLGDGAHYAQTLFESQEITGYLKNLLEAKKSITDAVVFDSSVEEDFAKELEASDQVKVFAKLPGWFQVPTPLGSYNPDWAVLATDAEGDRLYFVVETKGDAVAANLRDTEKAKIVCGTKHFETIAVSLGRPTYQVATTLGQMLAMR